MITARLKSILEKTLLITTIISFLTLILSGLIMMQFLQLLLSRNTYEIKTLYLLGYSKKTITQVFLRYFVFLFGIMGLLGLFVFIGFIPLVENFIVSSGFPLESSFIMEPYFAVIIAFSLFVLASFLTATRELKLLAQ